MSRRNRLLIWLGSLLALAAIAYASLPWLLETAARHKLAAQGFRDIRLRIDYPDWQGIRIHELAFTAVAGRQQIRLQVPAAAIEYHLSGLLTGRIDRIHVPTATLRIESVAVGVASTQAMISRQGATALPLAALVSGQWLAQLPLGELSLERLSLTWQTATHTVYALQLSAQLNNTQLQLKGEFNLPPLAKPMAFSFNASSTGKANLIVTAEAETRKPLLIVAVSSVDVNQDPMIVNGELHTKLESLMPMLRPWLTQLNEISDIEGVLKSQWQARINDSTWQLTGEAKLQGFGGQWRDLALPASEVTARFGADPRQATLQASLNTAGQAVVLQVKGLHQFASSEGHADFKLMPVEFSKTGFVLSHLLKAWPYPFDIEAGRASAGVQLLWHKMLKTKLDLQLDKLGGHYNKMTFNGLTSKMSLTMNAGIETRKVAHIHVDSLNVGFPVENIAVQFALTPTAGTRLPVVRIQKSSANLLGGRAHTGPFALDFTRDKNTFVVQLEHIGLDEIMLLEQQEGLEGSGLLEGTIPITLSRDGLEVVHGQLSVRAPGGVIRYSPTPKVAGLAQTNPGVDMVVKALSNFQYQVMDVRSDYKAKGDLELQVHLEGKNPDWQAGKPVHLNLNLQENIPTLLRSLQLGGEISERVRQHYQKSP